MDNETRIELAFGHLRNNLIERNDLRSQFPEQTNSILDMPWLTFPAPQSVSAQYRWRRGSLRHGSWAHTFAHATPARQQRVVLLNVRVGVKRMPVGRQ